MKIRKMLIFLSVLVSSLLTSAIVFAQEAAAGGDAGEGSSMKYMAAALAIGVAALGGALGQGRTASSALEGIARNPKAAGEIKTPMILGLALIESLVIYALLIAIMIVTA